MAENVGLLFQIAADASAATAELNRFQSLITNNLNSIAGLATRVGASLPNSLKGANSASDEAARKLLGTRDSVASLAKASTQLQPALSSASSALSGVGTSSSAASLAMGVLAVGAGAVVGAVTAIVNVANAVGSALASIGQAGVKTNAELETLRVGIATVIGSVGEFRNAEGIQLKGLDAINAALPIASDQLRKLRIDALDTSATIAQIAPAFQAGIGPGLAAGLNIDQIRENVIKLTQAVTALGLPADQLKQETRAILSGQIDQNTQAANALGITREAVVEAQKQGKFAEFLEQKLSAAAAAGKVVGQTFAAASSNLQEAGDTFQSVVTEGLFNQLRDKLNSILPQIFDKNQANLISKNFEGISETLTRVFDTAGQTIAKAIDAIFEGIKRVSTFLDKNQETVGAVIESVNQIVVILADVATSMLGITAGATGGQKAFEGVADVLKLIVQVVGFIADGIKIQVSLAFTLGNALRLAVVAPLELAVTILAKLLDFVPGVGGALDSFARNLTTARQAATAAVADSAKQFAGAVLNVGKTSADAAKRIDEARKRAASGQRAVDGVENPALKPSGATLRPPPRPKEKEKGAEEKARQEAAAELKELQQLEKAKELSLARQQARLKTALDDRLISEQAFVDASIEFDRELLAVKLNSLAAEEKAALRTAKNDEERAAKRAEFALKRAQVEQEVELRNEALRDQLRRKIEKAEEDHQKALLDLRAVADKQEVARIRDLESRRIVGNVNAERRVAEIEAGDFARRRAAIEAEFAKLPEGDTVGQQRLNDELAKLEQARVGSVEEASRRIRAAREREIEAQQAFQQTVTKSEQELAARQIEAEKQRIDRLSKVAVTPGDKNNVVKLRAANDRQAEELRSQQARDALRNQEDELQAQATTYEEVLRVTALFDQRFEEEKNRHRDALKAIDQDEAAGRQQVRTEQLTVTDGFDPSTAQAIAETEEALGRQLTLWERTTVAAQTYAQTLQAAAETAWARATDILGNLTKGITAAVNAFVQSGGSLKAAGKAITQALASPFIEAAKTRAQFEAAAAVAAAAALDFRGALLHGLAAAGFAALAAVGTALVNRAFSGEGGGGGESQGAGAFGGQRQPKETQITRGDVTGKLGPDAESQDRGPLKVLFDENATVMDRVRAAIEAHAQSVERAGEAQREVNQTLVARLSSMAPEDVLTVAVDRQPGLIADGVKESFNRDAGFKRSIAEGLLLS